MNTVIHIIRIIVLAALLICLIQAVAFLSADSLKDQLSGILRKVVCITFYTIQVVVLAACPDALHASSHGSVVHLLGTTAFLSE